MNDDHAHRTLEQKALANVRAQLDRSDPNAPLQSVGEAAGYLARTLPVVVGVLAVGLAIVIAEFSWRKYSRPPVTKTRSQYAADVFHKAEFWANYKRNEATRGLRGVVQVSFRVRPDGSVEGLEISKSSNDNRVDEAARNLVLVSQPFGEFGKGAEPTPLAIRGTWRLEARRITFEPDP